MKTRKDWLIWISDPSYSANSLVSEVSFFFPPIVYSFHFRIMQTAKSWCSHLNQICGVVWSLNGSKSYQIETFLSLTVLKWFWIVSNWTSSESHQKRLWIISYWNDSESYIKSGFKSYFIKIPLNHIMSSAFESYFIEMALNHISKQLCIVLY